MSMIFALSPYRWYASLWVEVDVLLFVLSLPGGDVEEEEMDTGVSNGS